MNFFFTKDTKACEKIKPLVRIPKFIHINLNVPLTLNCVDISKWFHKLYIFTQVFTFLYCALFSLIFSQTQWCMTFSVWKAFVENLISSDDIIISFIRRPEGFISFIKRHEPEIMLRSLFVWKYIAWYVWACMFICN